MSSGQSPAGATQEPFGATSPKSTWGLSHDVQPPQRSLASTPTHDNVTIGLPSILVSPSSPHQRTQSMDSNISAPPLASPLAPVQAQGSSTSSNTPSSTDDNIPPPTSPSKLPLQIDTSGSPAPALSPSSTSTSTANSGDTRAQVNPTSSISSFSFGNFFSGIIPRLTTTPTLHLVTSSDDATTSPPSPTRAFDSPASPDQLQYAENRFSPSSPISASPALPSSSISSSKNHTAARKDSTAFLRNLPGHFGVERASVPTPVAEEDEDEDDQKPKKRWSMDLAIDDAISNGQTFQENQAQSAPAITRSNSAYASTSPRGLTRRPSAAFVAASKQGQVHPLTLQAVARQGSEGEALKLVREREERERQLASAGSEGGSTLARKQSWTAALSGAYSATNSPAHSRTGSYGDEASGVKTPRTRQTSNGLPPVKETGSLGYRGSGAEEGEDKDATVTGRTGQVERDTSEASTSAAGEFGQSNHEKSGSPTDETPSGSSGVKKKGFFSRLGGGNRKRAPSSLSVRSFDTVSSRHSLDTPSSAALSESVQSPGFDRSYTSTSKKDPVEKIRFAKVKTKGKLTKDFGKLFLAQELFIPAPTTTGTAASATLTGRARSDTMDSSSTHSHESEGPASPEDSANGGADKMKKKNAVWCIKWSDDGKYLAVGGKDGAVRVWEVLKTPEERQAVSSPDEMSDSPYQLKVDPSTPSKNGTSGSSPTPGSSKKKGTLPRRPASTMPVFSNVPVREYKGHSADVLDLSWSKNNFLLSSSMDKTVRLWHISRTECLCAFQHLDFVTSIAFHPKDDRYFLSGSLDCKLRLWDIPNRRVQIWTELPELITSVAFSRDGKLSIAGSFNGQCMFFETETFHYHAQFAAKSSRGKNSKGRKITSMVPYPVPSSQGERLLVTSNDSRIRLYHTLDKSVESKYAGHENTSSQIRANFSEDGKYIISGSEDRCVYIWDSGLTAEREESGGWNPLKKAKEGAGYEWFPMQANIITCACFAPLQTRDVLAEADDPVFGDGHTHLAALMRTVSGASLGDGASSHLVPINTSASRATNVTSAAEDAIVVVADDATGVISIYRNSKVPDTFAKDSSLPKRRLSRSSPA